MIITLCSLLRASGYNKSNRGADHVQTSRSPGRLLQIALHPPRRGGARDQGGREPARAAEGLYLLGGRPADKFISHHRPAVARRYRRFLPAAFRGPEHLRPHAAARRAVLPVFPPERSPASFKLVAVPGAFGRAR